MMNKRNNSNRNRMHILIDRSVDLTEMRNQRNSISPSNVLASVKTYSPNKPKVFRTKNQLKLPMINPSPHLKTQQQRTSSVRRNNNLLQNMSSIQQQTQNLVSQLSNVPGKRSDDRNIAVTEKRRQSSLSAYKLYSHQMHSKRTRSISNMVSKNSLCLSTQVNEEDETGKSRLEQSFHKGQSIKMQLFNELHKLQQQDKDTNKINQLRDSMMQVIDQCRLHRMYKYHGNTDQQIKLLEQLYLQNEQIVRNYVEIRQEAQDMDQRVKSIARKKQIQQKRNF